MVRGLLAGSLWPLFGIVIVSGCGAEPKATEGSLASAVTSSDAHPVLEKAQRAMGARDALERISVIESFAECDGPRGPFQTRVISARDGRMRFEHASSTGRFLAGIREEGAWSYDPETGEVVDADISIRTFLEGHELHMLALAPETRLRRPELLGEREFSGVPVYAVRFLDDADAEVEMYYSIENALPAGMKNVNHSGQGARDVLVRFDDWREHDGLLLFRKAVFSQGEEDYVYDYVELDLNASPERLRVENAGG
jgi:hypothetical protein